MNRKFTNNWFTGHIGLFNHFLNDFRNKENLKFLEVGSFEGQSTCFMLDNFLKGKDSTITCIDSWQGGREHSDIDFKVVYELFLNNIGSDINKCQIIKGISFEELIKLNVSNISLYDFIYIDGGHTMKDVIQDIILSFRLLKSGGVMAMDDYLWGSEIDSPSNPLPQHLRPQFAIDCFLVAYKDEYKLLHRAGQVWIRKN